MREKAAMTTTSPSVPAAFTHDDFAARMSRVVKSAVEKGLAGVIVTPGPDLLWLLGYRPTAITERLTMLVLSPNNEPTLLVPVLERPEAAEGVGSSVSLVAWKDGTDPMRSPAHYSGQTVSSASPTPPGPCICSACNECCHGPTTGR